MIGYAASNWMGMNTGIPAVCGPLGHSVRDLNLLCTVVREKKPWQYDPALIPQIFEQKLADRRPIVGVVHQSGLTPHPPVLRAIKEAAAKLAREGFEVKEFTPVDFVDIRKVTSELFTVDGLSYPKQELIKAGEPVVDSVEKVGFWSKKAKSPEETWRWNAEKLKIQKDMLDRWIKAKVDVVLCPAGPYSPLKPGDWSEDHYTVAWNAVGVSGFWHAF